MFIPYSDLATFRIIQLKITKTEINSKKRFKLISSSDERIWSFQIFLLYKSAEIILFGEG